MKSSPRKRAAFAFTGMLYWFSEPDIECMLKFFVVLFVVFTALLLVASAVRSWMLSRSDDQQIFASGILPAPLPDGFYAGTASPRGQWKGKVFDRANAKGINIFGTRSGAEKEAYPFKTSVGKGLRDSEKDVLKIDYDLEGNPFWLRPALDEVVQVEPGILLGKLHYRLIPGFPFTLTFFRLEMN